jgi:hypothetical protein
MKTPEDEAFEEIERIQRTRTRWVAVEKPQDEIEHMWKVASNNPNHDSNWHDPVVVAFAKLVTAKEREACAKVCEETDDGTPYNLAKECAAAIRARGQA